MTSGQRERISEKTKMIEASAAQAGRLARSMDDPANHIEIELQNIKMFLDLIEEILYEEGEE